MRKAWQKACIASLLCMGIVIGSIFTSCERNVDEPSDASDDDSVSVEAHDDEDDYEWNDSTEVQIYLEGASATASEGPVTISGSQVEITSSGTFRISGHLDNGQVLIDSDADSTVRVIFDGVNISNSSGAPFVISNAGKTVLILEDGTENELSDASYYDSGEDGPNACLYSADDLSISGEGSLSIEANYNDGICSKDGLVIDGPVIRIESVDDGIRGKDYLIIRSGDISLDVAGDGLKSDLEEEETLGSITIEGGDIDIEAGDDAIHSTGDITFEDGVLTLDAGDDAVHADYDLLINYAEIDISVAYEGLESGDGNITINDGIIRLVSSDDGINLAAGGDSGGGFGPRSIETSTNDETDSEATHLLQINGGYIVINAQGDGFDSNGDAEMNDGILLIHGPTENNNGAIDVNGSFDMNGGFLVAAGSSNMAESPSTTSELYSVKATLGTQSAATLFHIESSSGEELLTFAPDKSYASVVFSSPALEKGSSYSAYLGGSHSGTAADGLYAEGSYTPGNSLGSFTITTTVQSIQ